MKQKKQPLPSGKEKRKVTTKRVVHPFIYLTGIVVLTLMLYSGSLRNDILTFDDNEYFSNYPEVLNLSWSSVKKYFTEHYLIMYQPLPVLTFAINYYFTGLNTFPLHVVNLLLHLACIVLVFRFIRDLTSNNAAGLIVALLFAVHPMNVEAVAWISARSSSMYTFFYLFALIYYLKFLKEYSVKFIYIAGVFFILSLFSKAQAVTFPVVLLLLDYYHGRNILSRKVILEKIPFFILSIIFGVITLSDSGTQSNLTAGMLVDYDPADLIFLVTYSFSFYLFKLFLPVNLCAVYVYPPKTGGLLPLEYYASAILIGALLYLLFRFRRNKTVLLCVGLFLITIAINIQLIPSRLFIVTDRYAYFPFIGLFLMPVLLLNEYRKTSPEKFQKYYVTLVSIFAAMIIAFSAMTVNRTGVWKNDFVLLTDIINKNAPVKYIARAYGNRGFAYKKINEMGAALSDFNESLKLDPNDARTYFNRGLIFVAQNDLKRARNDFDTAIAIDSMQSTLYSMRGQIRLMLSDTTGAISDAGKSLKLNAADFDSYNTLANINFSRGEYSECEHNLTQAIHYNPKFDIAIKNRGLLYIRMNRLREACHDLMSASYMNNEEAKTFYSQYCK